MPRKLKNHTTAFNQAKKAQCVKTNLRNIPVEVCVCV